MTIPYIVGCYNCDLDYIAKDIRDVRQRQRDHRDTHPGHHTLSVKFKEKTVHSDGECTS
jgi:hypothetical protein